MMMPPSTTTTPPSAAAAAASSSKSMVLNQDQNALKCPRCDSSNTKFCYYNNYSLSQPRHFCKACKRYWTRGGTLRNVPVGGGCRKNKRVKKQQPAAAAAAATTATTATVTIHSNPQPPLSSVDGSLFYGSAKFGPASFGLEELIPSDQLSAGLINANLNHLQQSASFLNNDYPASFGSQACASMNLGFLKDIVKVEGDSNLMGISNNISTQWQDIYPFEASGASDASYLHWNSVAMAGVGWPDPANSSVAPPI